MIEDLAGFFLEAGAIRTEERINPREFKIIDGKVFDQIRQEKVNERWKGGTPLADIEARGAERFYNFVLQGQVAISISSEGGISPYKETRINIAHLVNPDTIHLYGIASNFIKDDCWNLAWRLNEFSKGQFNPQDIDDLREMPIPILIPPELDIWDFLNIIAPLDSDAWDDIKAGNPWIRKELARQKAEKVVNEGEPMVSSARTSYDYIRAGAYMEISMQRQVGWSIGKRGCPGALNSELLVSMFNQTLNLGYTLDVFGNLRNINSTDKDDYGSLKFKCPACGHINTRPHGEFISHCQNEDCPNPSAVRC